MFSRVFVVALVFISIFVWTTPSASATSLLRKRSGTLRVTDHNNSVINSICRLLHSDVSSGKQLKDDAKWLSMDLRTFHSLALAPYQNQLNSMASGGKCDLTCLSRMKKCVSVLYAELRPQPGLSESVLEHIRG
eukprot:gnl/Spiro4/9608_TR5099_c0_g1_i1.p2 gnl/Spiro4/9608_TR5099_c0_g1~~gnl/Spiro4/9608_TR5099_c0_g1_i1.p2  ORF type:complete len:134 (+),score=22.45 gnl/Spiro4/9608_TR5099_c0_g1_i1:146-547(+)